MRKATLPDTGRLIWMAIALLLVVRIAISWHDIQDPGLHFDESLFVNAATLRVPGIFIQDSFLGIPTMVFPYIGALKSWIYTPIFAIFGNRPATIRMPVVFIASAGLVLLYLGVRDLVNRPVALLTFVVLCFDNSVFWLTRDDVGPSSIEFFLKCAAIFFAARWVRAPRARWLGLLVAALGLGVFNKLNFIWVVNAAAVVSAVVIVSHRRSLRRHVRELAVWCVGMAALYGAFGWYYTANRTAIPTGSIGLSVIAHNWQQFELGMRQILSGTWFYGYALGPLAARDGVVWIIFALFAAGTVGSVIAGRTRNFVVAMLALATVLIAVQNLVTAQATAGWHYVSIYPMVIIVAAYGAYVVADLILKERRKVAVALACVGLASLVYSGTLMADYYGAIGKDTSNSAWSPRIYQLAGYFQSHPGIVFTADWGILDPLFALHPSYRYRELEFELTNSDPVNLKAVASEVADTPGPKFIVTHGPATLVFPTTLANLMTAFAHHLHLVRVFSERDGAVLYEVYAYT